MVPFLCLFLALVARNSGMRFIVSCDAISYFADHVGTFSCPFSSVYYFQLAPLTVHNRILVGTYQALYVVYRGCTTDTLHKDPDLNQQEFYCVLAEELIDNNIWRRGGNENVPK